MKKTTIILTLMFVSIITSIQAQTWEEIQKVLPTMLSNKDDYYGGSVSVDGDYAVVGSRGYKESGCAYVLHKNGNDWETLARLTPSDSTGESYFGMAVAISGDNIVVGANGYSDTLYRAGIVYVYHKPPTGWTNMTETAVLRPSTPKEKEYFGVSVAIDGDVIIAGDRPNYSSGGGKSINEENLGVVYVFKQPTTGWVNTSEIAKLSSSDVQVEDEFGTALSISEDYIVAGATYNDTVGSAYIFEKPQTGWTDANEIAKLTSSDGANFDCFGGSVSISGDNVIVGAFHNDTTGSAYIYEKPSSGWVNITETAKIIASDGAEDDEFGCSVSIYNNTIVVGAGSNNNYGAAYIFEKPLSGWANLTENAKLTASDSTQDSYFGCSVSISGDNILSGAANNTNSFGESAGAVYAFEKPVSGWANTVEDQIIYPIPYANNEENRYGYSVEIDGDYAVVGAFGYDNNRGSASVLHFNGANWETMALLKASNGEAGDAFGTTVGISGNTIIVSSYRHNNNTGIVYVYEKPVNGWMDTTETAILTTYDTLVNNYFGTDIDIFGDNIIASGLGVNTRGLVYLYEKPLTGWADMTETATLTASDVADDDRFGTSVRISNDIVVVGSPRNDAAGSDAGAAYIFEKPITGWADMTQTIKLTESNNSAYNEYGKDVDIYEDIVIVSSEEMNNNSNGTIYVYEKPVTGWTNITEIAKLTSSDGDYHCRFGERIGVYDNTIVIASSNDYHIPNSLGTVYVYEKPLTGWSDTTETIKIAPSDGSKFFGASIGISGNTIIIGADYDEDNGYSAGANYIFKKTFFAEQPLDNTNICVAETVMFTVSADSADAFQWQQSTDNGNTWIDLSDNSTYSGVTTDTLNVITNINLNNYQYRCNVSNSVNNETSNSVILSFDTELPAIVCIGNQTVTADATHNYIVSGTEFDLTYSNDNCGVASIINNFNNSSTLDGETLPEGITTITWVVTDNIGNIDSCSFDITVDNYVGVENTVSENEIKIYPNPAHNMLTISNDQLIIENITILDITGKVVKQLTIEQSNNLTIEIEDLKQGIYFIKLTTNNTTEVVRLIKK